MDKSLHILITGASRGLGAALARGYAKHYGSELQLSLVARDKNNLLNSEQQCLNFGAKVNSYAVDISEPNQIIELIESLETIDIAIINAGITGDSHKATEPWQQQEAIIKTNLLGAMACTHALIPAMQKRASGSIVLISSVAAYRGFGLTPTYCASKAGLKAYADSIRDGLAAQGVKVHLVLPGFIQTDMSNKFKAAKPFMLKADMAAELIINKINRGQWVISFPRLLSYSQRLLNCLPARWGDAILKRMGYGSPDK